MDDTVQDLFYVYTKAYREEINTEDDDIIQQVAPIVSTSKYTIVMYK